MTGNNSFYFTTNLNTGNYNFVSPTGYGRGSNILAKMQLDVAIGGVVFFRDQTNFMNRFSNQSLTYINVVLYDENFDPWIPNLLWSCVLEFKFFEEYNGLTHEAIVQNFLNNK